MWKNDKYVREIFFTKKFNYMLDELRNLGFEDVLDKPLECKYLLLKGLQRFLLYCNTNNIDLHQAFGDLITQGSLFAKNMPFSNSKCCDIYNIFLKKQTEPNDLAHSYSFNKNDVEKQSLESDQMLHSESLSNNSLDKNKASSDEDDWSGFAGSMGINL